MYRTATIACYDVLDTVFIVATVKEYLSTPGTLPPVEYVFHTSIPSRGEDDAARWLMEGLNALAGETQA